MNSFLRRNTPGFTLLELLVVIAIIAVLVSASIGSFASVARGRNLTHAAGMVVDQIALSRQTALSENSRVRWQIIKIAQSRTGAPEDFRLLRQEIFDSQNRKWKACGRPLWLPSTVKVDVANSTLLHQDSVKEIGKFSYGGETNEAATAGEIVFHPSGYTSLDPNKIYSLTLCDAATAKNFITIQIDPVSGHTRIFQP